MISSRDIIPRGLRMRFPMLLALSLVVATVFAPVNLCAQAPRERSRRATKVERDIAKLEERRLRLLAEIKEVESKITRLKNEARQPETPTGSGVTKFARIEPDGLPAILRKTRSIASETVLEIPAGSEVRVLGFRGGYWKVEYDGFTGYLIDHAIADSEVSRRYRGSGFRRRTAGIRPASRGGCCKICRSGKACGNSCIGFSKSCRKPPGCACNG